VELLGLLNPIRTAVTRDAAAHYAVEPYVLAGDVYDNPDHRGRGGWSWYTGSAGWYYRVAVESVLGIGLRGNRLTVRPRVAGQWPEYTVRLRYKSATYAVRAEGPFPAEAAARELWADGVRVEGNELELSDDGREHDVRVIFG